ELHLRADGTTWAQRYYAAGGITAAMRSNQTGTTKVTYFVSDHHGTSHLAINRDSTLAFTKRYTTPFGADRGKTQYGPWPDDKGFLGKSRDAATGLTHIDAREYDPVIGQFISVDPLLKVGTTQTFNGYSYGDNNPATLADPTGQCPFIDCPTRPSPNHENRTPIDRGPIKAPKFSSNYQAAVSAGNVVAPAVTKDFQEVYPGVFVKRKWKYANDFGHVLTQKIDTYCSYAGPSCLTGGDTPQAQLMDQAQMALLKFHACVKLGRESGCLGNVVSIGVAMGAAFRLGGSGMGPGGGVNAGPGLLSRARELFSARADTNSTVAVAQVRNVKTDKTETWVATEQSGLPREWKGGSAPLRGERYISGDGHAEAAIMNRLGNDWKIDAMASSTRMCPSCYEQATRNGLSPSGIGKGKGQSPNTPWRVVVGDDG
ncbi:RHS repeat-associated core domain-containing protein, partial [Streptomyces sp. NPDC045251]